MRVRLDRDSVAMGDDAVPHDTEVACATLRDLGRELDGYLPSVAGRTTWVLRSGGERRPVAVVDLPEDRGGFLGSLGAAGRGARLTWLVDDRSPAEPSAHVEYLASQPLAETLALVRAEPGRSSYRLAR